MQTTLYTRRNRAVYNDTRTAPNESSCITNCHILLVKRMVLEGGVWGVKRACVTERWHKQPKASSPLCQQRCTSGNGERSFLRSRFRAWPGRDPTPACCVCDTWLPLWLAGEGSRAEPLILVGACLPVNSLICSLARLAFLIPEVISLAFVPLSFRWALQNGTPVSRPPVEHLAASWGEPLCDAKFVRRFFSLPWLYRFLRPFFYSCAQSGTVTDDWIACRRACWKHRTGPPVEGDPSLVGS